MFEIENDDLSPEQRTALNAALAPLSEISGVEAAEIEGKGHRVCLPFQKLSKLIQIHHTGKV